MGFIQSCAERRRRITRGNNNNQGRRYSDDDSDERDRGRCRDVRTIQTTTQEEEEEEDEALKEPEEEEDEKGIYQYRTRFVVIWSAVPIVSHWWHLTACDFDGNEAVRKVAGGPHVLGLRKSSGIGCVSQSVLRSWMAILRP